MEVLWIAVSHDEYELPVAVAESVEELAAMCNVSVRSIRTMIAHEANPKYARGFCKYKKIEVGDD